MPIDRLTDTEIITRQARLTTLGYGFFELVSCAEISAPVSQTELPTGQMRPTGRTPSVDVAMAIMFSRSDEVERLNAWNRAVKAGAPGKVQKGASLQYYLEGDVPGRLIVLEECYPHTLVFPATDLGSEGTAGQLRFNLSIFRASLQPGT